MTTIQAPPPAAPAAPGIRPPAPAADGVYASARIMIVDDEPINIKVARKHLQGAGFVHFVTTTESVKALELVAREKPDVILLDVMMPGVDGLQILAGVRGDARLRHIPVLILTASTDSATKLKALQLGATDFLGKPVDPDELAPRVRNALIVKAHHDHLASHSQELERQVRARTAALELSRLQVVQSLARAGEYRDDTTGRHVIRVGRCAAIIGAELGMTAKDASRLEMAAQLHDIGKIGIPDSILLKPGKLDAAEFALMKKHCAYGKSIIEPTSDDAQEAARRHPELAAARGAIGQSPLLAAAARIAYTHHERWNGLGYPRGLAGEEIPVEGRVTAVADVFDALHSVRPYKPAFPTEKCLSILNEGRGKDFDPRILDAAFRRLAEIAAVYVEYADPE